MDRIVGLELGLIAEDGNLYPGLPREQSAALLAAGKTLDALVTMPATDITLSLFDRRPQPRTSRAFLTRSSGKMMVFVLELAISVRVCR